MVTATTCDWTWLWVGDHLNKLLVFVLCPITANLCHLAGDLSPSSNYLLDAGTLNVCTIIWSKLNPKGVSVQVTFSRPYYQRPTLDTATRNARIFIATPLWLYVSSLEPETKQKIVLCVTLDSGGNKKKEAIVIEYTQNNYAMMTERML